MKMAADAVSGNNSSLNPDDRDDQPIGRVYMVYRLLFRVVGAMRTYTFSQTIAPIFETSSSGIPGP